MQVQVDKEKYEAIKQFLSFLDFYFKYIFSCLQMNEWMPIKANLVDMQKE